MTASGEPPCWEMELSDDSSILCRSSIKQSWDVFISNIPVGSKTGKFMERCGCFVRKNCTYMHTERCEHFGVLQLPRGIQMLVIHRLLILIQTHSLNPRING